jgi:PAS domain S-box-containing protein
MSSAGQLSELDLLRGQVADLSRQLAERDRSAQDLCEQSDLLRAIVEGTAAETGEEFFASVVTHLTSVLKVQYAVIGEVQGDRIKKIRTLAVSAGGALVDNFEYELAHTPCATALAQTFAFFDRGVQATFPQFQRLVDLGAESYCAVPLRTKSGAVTGLLVVMDTNPLERGDYLQSLLGVFAPRIAAEFERKRAEQERTQALTNLHNVIETIPDIVFALNTQGNLVKWNRRLEDVTGYSHEELLNMPALAFVPPEEHIPTAAAIERAFMEGYAELEGHLLTKDHRLIPYHWTGALLNNSHDEPIGITGIGRDVSDKKRADEAVRESEERLVLAVEGSNDILWDAHRLPGEPWYAPQTPIWWSPRVRELLGLQESDSFETFEQWVARLHPDDKDRVFGQLAAHIEQRVPYDVEYRLRTNAGDYRWIRGRGQALWDEQGEPSRMSGSCQDITERKGVEEALRASEERWQLAVRGSNDGIWDWDIQSGTVFFSPRWKAMRGFGEHEITSHVEEWQSRIHPDDLDRVLKSLDAYVAKQAPDFCEEYRTRRKDGSYMWILDRGLALWADDGTPLRMVGSESDITEHKQALLRLVAQESLLRSILDTEPECVNRVADDGTILQMNKAGLSFIESDSFEQVTGLSVFDLVAPEFLERYRSMHEAVIRGASQQFEFQIVGLKGTRRWMETHAVPLRNPIDHRMEHLAITRDITHRKRTETALRESEERYRTLVDLSPNGVLVYSNGKKVYVNRAACRIMGASSPEQLLDNPTFHFSHPDDHASIHESIAQILATGKPVRRVERKYQRLDGAAIFVEVDAGRIMWNCEPAIQIIFADITERKLAQEKRYQSEAQLQAILDNSPSLIFLKDLDGRYLRVNREFETLFRTTEEETVGRTDRDIFPPEQAAVFQSNDEKVLRGGMPMLFEEAAVHGNNLHVSIVHKFPLRDKEGALYAIGGIATDITERKRAEEALREREEALARFKVTLDQTHDCVFMFAPDTLRFIYCNRGAVEQVGYSEAELFTMTPLDIKPEFTEQSFREMLRALQDGQRVAHLFETVHRHKNGHDVPVEVSLQLVREQGQEGRFVSVVRDITDRKRAEEVLRKSEERFDLAVRGSNTGIWDWDLRTGKTYFSPLWKSMLGYEEHELRGEFFEWEDRLHPDDRERSSATVRAYLKGTTPQYELEHRLRHKDGSYRWILARGVSICDAEGKPYRMAGSHIDITAQKLTQEALAHSERQLRTVLDALPVGVWFTDRAGKMLLANPAAKQIWSNIKQIGLQTENSQAGWWETIGPAMQPHRWALSHVLTTGAPAQYETFDFECLDGTKKAIRNSTVPVKNEDGVILGAIVLNEDITMLRQAQVALQLTQFSVDHAVEGFLWIESDARIFHANDSICRMLEYTCEEITTMTLHDIDPNLTSEVWPALWEELKEKGSLTFESKYWSRTGRVLDMEVTVNYLQYEGKEYNCAIMRDIGERKRAQEALRTSEERYRALYDETPTMYFTLATDGTVLSVNRFGAEQLGYQVEEIIGHSVLRLFHEDDKETVAASLSECLATQEATRHWEFRKVRKDASVIWVQETVHVGQSSSGEAIVLVTCEDITERKRVEHESCVRAQQASAMQSALLELAHLDDTRLMFAEILPQVSRIVAEILVVERVSLWLLSEDQTELVCQNLYLRGQATHSAGSRLAASRYPRYCAVLKESLVIAASNARVDQRTSEFADDYFPSLGITSVLDVPISRQGKLVGVLWCEHVGVPREWTHEAQDFAASVGQTIVRMIEAGERRQAEEALRKKSLELDRYFSSALDLLCIADVTGHFKRLNKAWELTLGYPLEELEGAKFLDYVHPDDLESTLRALDGLADQKEVVGFVNRYRRKDGSYRWIEWKSIPSDELIYAAARDITERILMEERLRQRERDLRAAIEERERISQDLHDGILQSLFAVGLAIESAKLTMLPRNLKVSGTSLNQAIGQLNDVMREIRNFIAGMGSDLLQGKDLPAALKQMLASLTEHQETRVRLAVEDRAAKALSTEQSLHLIRVIQEAVSNCVRHGRASEARVSLKMLKRGVRLSVRDNGCGFNQDAIKKAGRGLANMAARARKLGGRFTILSKVNEGTNIVLDFPKEAADVSR